MAQQVTWQDYKTVAVRTAAILTGSYVAGTIIGAAVNTAAQLKTNDQVDQFNFLALECNFTIGSLTDAQIKIEFSDDGTTYYQLCTGAVSGGTDTMTLSVIKLGASGAYYIDVNKEYFGGGGFKTKYIRVSSIGTGTVDNSSLAITAVVGVA